MSVYPNPALSDIAIGTEGQIKSVTICDMYGVVVQREITKTFSISGLASGVYTLSVATNKGLAYSRFVKE